ncbi:DNA gyrase inhibitor YacG [Brenneria tiliae]|uniref:DNA gyrase inhibitor YacG n=1 Tax=Brenneria tiliae TaxID=2914984 RepID=A0ABT0MWF6_9GAMM|nr:DNA gyrase inhibitor YacG [Brenneria tiliae]MCL2894087.1 DNA gyrase inhibitor YacG [Brenneria tiliae]MCL2898925.1 DNA gyrase inhibitor YacG [Brenneria tiliae]MCL2903138.1 DNA gyrase inhibitor YacG [Brenneria tiliae]
MTNDVTTVKCPTCKKTVIWNEKSVYRPFCSKRCQLIDLGEWADEEKRIPSDDIISDSEDWSEPQH